jgi:hypothetical protein
MVRLTIQATPQLGSPVSQMPSGFPEVSVLVGQIIGMAAEGVKCG